MIGSFIARWLWCECVNVWAEAAEDTEGAACGRVLEGSHEFPERTAAGEGEGEAE